jgi:hypothetical protein
MTEPSETGNGNPVWLVDAKRSPVGFWFVSCAGLLLLAAAVVLGLHLRSVAELALAAILVTGGFLFLSVAIVLGASRGGAAFFPGEEVVRLFGRSSADALTVPLADLTGIAVIRRSELWGKDDSPVLVSSVELATRSGPTLHLLEFASLEDAREAALMFRTVLKLPVTEPPEPALPEDSEPDDAPAAAEQPPTPSGTARPQSMETVEPPTVPPLVQQQIRVGPGWGLGIAVLPAALFCLLSGGLMLAGVKSTGVLGFLFGPVALFTGVGLGALWIYKAFGAETIVRTVRALDQTHRCGPFHWRGRRLDFDSLPLRCRIRSRGPNGFCIEALAGSHLLILASGAGAGTQMPAAELFELARKIESGW